MFEKLSGLILVALFLWVSPCGAEVSSATLEIDYQAFLTVYEKIQEQESHIEQLRKKAYAKNPCLKKFEEKYRVVSADPYSMMPSNGKRIGDLLREEKKRGESTVKDAVNALKPLYQRRFCMTQGNNNPDYDVLVKALLTEKRMRVLAERYKDQGLEVTEEDISSADGFYVKFQEYYTQKLPGVLRRIERAEKRSGLSEEVLALIQDYAEKQSLLETYPAYIYVKTPDEVKEAEETLKKLYRKSHKIWPHWRRGTKGNVEEYLQRLGVSSQ